MSAMLLMMTGEDDDQIHDDWTDKYHSYGQQPTFAKDSGPLIVLPPEASAIDFFNLLFLDSQVCTVQTISAVWMKVWSGSKVDPC